MASYNGFSPSDVIIHRYNEDNGAAPPDAQPFDQNAYNESVRLTKQQEIAYRESELLREKQDQERLFKEIIEKYGIFGLVDLNIQQRYFGNLRYYEKVIEVLNEPGIDLNIKDRIGNNLLHYALSYYAYDKYMDPIVSALIKKNPILINEKNNAGHTPLMRLINIKYPDVGYYEPKYYNSIYYFLKIVNDNKLLDIPELDLTVLNDKGSNILHILVYMADEEYRKNKNYKIGRQYELVKTLIRKIIDRYPEISLQKNNQGKTPMDYDTSKLFKELYSKLYTPVTPVSLTLAELNAKLKRGGKRRTLRKRSSRRKRTYKHK